MSEEELRRVEDERLSFEERLGLRHLVDLAVRAGG
jgi:hypothetical protein